MTRTVRETPPKLSAIQAPVRAPLERVGDEIRRIVLSDFDHIDEMQEVNYEGRVYTPERALRELIRQQGKAMARKTFEKMVGEADAQRLYFPKQEK